MFSPGPISDTMDRGIPRIATLIALPRKPSMTPAFIAQNDLERQLIAAQDGHRTAESFIETLLGSEVFMPVYEKHQIGGFQTQQTAQPLKLINEEGAEALVLFTSPERAKDFVKDHPGFGGGLVADFTWILEKLGVGYAIMLNPGCDYGMDFEAQDVAQLATMSQSH